MVLMGAREEKLRGVANLADDVSGQINTLDTRFIIWTLFGGFLSAGIYHFVSRYLSQKIHRISLIGCLALLFLRQTEKGGNLGFYISDIILRGLDQVSAECGWSPYNKDSVSGWQKILSSVSRRYGSTYFSINPTCV